MHRSWVDDYRKKDLEWIDYREGKKSSRVDQYTISRIMTKKLLCIEFIQESAFS